MKKVLFTALIAALCVGFSACRNDDFGGYSSDNLVGTWQLTRQYVLEKTNGNITTKIDENLSSAAQKTTVYFSEHSDGAVAGPKLPLRLNTNTFRWSMSGNKLRIMPQGQDNIVWVVEKLTSDQLTITITEHDMDKIGVYDNFYQETYRRVSRD